VFKARERAPVVGHSKVVAVAAQLARHGLPEVGEGLRIACLTEPAIALPQSTAQSLLRGLALEPYLACPGPSPVMGKTEEVQAWQSLSVPQGLAGVICPTSQQTRLVCIETPPALPQP
jgi:hypothetical protein